MEIALIDNESSARSMLRTFIKACKQEVTIVGEAHSVESGVEMINTLRPQGILLDVEMDDGSGFDLLNQLDDVKPNVVFVTAFDHYALQAFRADAVDYLEKPIEPEQLVKALQKLRNQISLEQATVYPTLNPLALQSLKERIAVPTRFGTLYLKTREILFAQADGSYSEIHMVNGKRPHVISRRLQQVDEALQSLGFVRVHRSYIVNVARVQELSKTDGGFVVLDSGLQIPFSKHYKEKAFEAIQTLTTAL